MYFFARHPQSLKSLSPFYSLMINPSRARKILVIDESAYILALRIKKNKKIPKFGLEPKLISYKENVLPFKLFRLNFKYSVQPLVAVVTHTSC